MENRIEFLKKEYECLKTEIRDYSLELNELMKYSILFSAGAYSIFFKIKEVSEFMTYSKYFVFFPFVLNILLFLRFASIGYFIQVISEYLEGIERKFLEDNEGWETHLNSNSRKTWFFKSKFSKLTLMSIPSIIYWITTIFISGFFICLYSNSCFC